MSEITRNHDEDSFPIASRETSRILNAKVGEFGCCLKDFSDSLSWLLLDLEPK